MHEVQNIAVHVVAWNSLPYLPGLFASLDEQTTREFSVTVIDNASTDGTTNWIEQNALGTAILRNFKNQGFSRAHNQAISLTLSRWPEEVLASRYVLIANPDLEFAPDCLEYLRAFMDSNPDISICGPKLLRAIARLAEGEEGGRETERTDIIDSTGIVMFKTRRHADRGAGEKDGKQYDSETDVFGLSGACVMIRASALKDLKVGNEWFDEDFFAYKEDVDLAWRARRFGMQARLVPQAIAWHHRRAASGSQGFLWLKAFAKRFSKPKHINFYSTRNHRWLTWKNDETKNRLAHAPWILLYEFGKTFVGVFSGTSWKAWIQGEKGLKIMHAKRREMKDRVQVRGADMRKWFV